MTRRARARGRRRRRRGATHSEGHGSGGGRGKVGGGAWRADASPSRREAAGGGVAAALYSFFFPFSSFCCANATEPGFSTTASFGWADKRNSLPDKLHKAILDAMSYRPIHFLPAGRPCSTQHFSHKDKLWTYLLAVFEQVVIFVRFSNLT